MRKKSYAFIRSHRRKWGLTQVDLARLLGLASSTAVSRIERSKRVPTAVTIIACGIIFDLTTPDLFPSLHAEIEEAVCLVVSVLLEELGDKVDDASTRKRTLLRSIRERVTSRKQKPHV